MRIMSRQSALIRHTGTLHVKNATIAALALLLTVSPAANALAQDDKAAAKSTQPAAKPARPAAPKAAKPHAAAPKAQGAETAPAQENASGAKEGAKEDATPPSGEIDQAEAIKRANAFFNASPVMTADFVQIGADGRRAEGRLHVQRAGRVRFEYAQPATLEVVSDGAQVLVRDRKLDTKDLYFIDQTPLKFLMKEKIDLEHDVKVLEVTHDDSGVMISVEDKATFGGASHLKFIFDPKTFKLKQWQIIDPQGYETLVSLFNIDQKTVPDPGLFKIDAATATPAPAPKKPE